MTTTDKKIPSVGPKNKVKYTYIRDILLSPDGTYMLVGTNYSVYKICLLTNEVTIFVSEDRELDFFFANLLFSLDEKFVYCCGPYCIYKICVDSRTISIFAGSARDYGLLNGPKEQALFTFPRFITLSQDAKKLCVTCYRSTRSICLESGEVSTIKYEYSRSSSSSYILELTSDRKHLYIGNKDAITILSIEDQITSNIDIHNIF